MAIEHFYTVLIKIFEKPTVGYDTVSTCPIELPVLVNLSRMLRVVHNKFAYVSFLKKSLNLNIILIN